MRPMRLYRDNTKASLRVNGRLLTRAIVPHQEALGNLAGVLVFVRKEDIEHRQKWRFEPFSFAIRCLFS